MAVDVSIQSVEGQSLNTQEAPAKKNPLVKNYDAAKLRITGFSTRILDSFRGVSGEKPANVNLQPEAQQMQALSSALRALEQKTDEGLSMVNADSSEAISHSTREDEGNMQEINVNERKLTKVGHQEGSNEGGWYIDESTGERFYVKFYKDMNQGKMEVIANQVYEKLEIPAPHSELITVDGRQAVASKEIGDHHRVTSETLRSNDDVLSGFVADAFLANWDVVGLVYDNIEQAEDGRMYRIDNGSALAFRAQGAPKAYSPETIEELETLRNPSINPQSSEVFKLLTEDDLVKQARYLVNALTLKDIDAIVGQANLPAELVEVVRVGMKGRREYLIQRFHLNGELKKEPVTEKASSELSEKQEPISPEDYAPFPEKSVAHIFDTPDKSTYSTVVFEAKSYEGDQLDPTKRIIYVIPQNYRDRVIRDVILKHRKDSSHFQGEGWDTEGAYSRVLVRTSDGKWRSWIDPKGYNSDKFAEPRSASDPENEVLHDWIATVGEVKPTVISVENIGHGANAISNIHGLEVVFFPETEGVKYDQTIFSPGTSFIDLEKDIQLPTYGGGKQFGGKYPNAVVLGGLGNAQNLSIDRDKTKPLYTDEQGRLHIKLQPGKKFIGLEVSAGDTHPDGITNKQGGIGTLGWAKIYAGLKTPGQEDAQYFMRNVNVPPAGVLAGGYNEAEHIVKDGEELVIESKQDATYVMGYRIAYKE